MLALGTGHHYVPRHVPGTYFCLRLSRPQGYNAAGRKLTAGGATKLRYATFATGTTLEILLTTFNVPVQTGITASRNMQYGT